MTSGEDGSRWIVAGADAINGAAYYAPESFGPGVWNILFMGVLPDKQGSAIGSELLAYIEKELQQDQTRREEIYLHTSKAVSDLSHNKKILDTWATPQNKKYSAAQIQATMHKNCPTMKHSAIYLNPRLIKSSIECIDYVITHELLHIRHKKHNQEFYAALEKQIPTWNQVTLQLESYR